MSEQSTFDRQIAANKINRLGNTANFFDPRFDDPIPFEEFSTRLRNLLQNVWAGHDPKKLPISDLVQMDKSYIKRLARSGFAPSGFGPVMQLELDRWLADHELCLGMELTPYWETCQISEGNTVLAIGDEKRFGRHTVPEGAIYSFKDGKDAEQFARAAERLLTELNPELQADKEILRLMKTQPAHQVVLTDAALEVLSQDASAAALHDIIKESALSHSRQIG
jgi:hypothetical protein